MSFSWRLLLRRCPALCRQASMRYTWMGSRAGPAFTAPLDRSKWEPCHGHCTCRRSLLRPRASLRDGCSGRRRPHRRLRFCRGRTSASPRNHLAAANRNSAAILNSACFLALFSAADWRNREPVVDDPWNGGDQPCDSTSHYEVRANRPKCRPLEPHAREIEEEGAIRKANGNGISAGCDG